MISKTSRTQETILPITMLLGVRKVVYFILRTQIASNASVKQQLPWNRFETNLVTRKDGTRDPLPNLHHIHSTKAVSTSNPFYSVYTTSSPSLKTVLTFTTETKLTTDFHPFYTSKSYCFLKANAKVRKIYQYD
jgi:hypothetical protein